jgi:hypothetical protein
MERDGNPDKAILPFVVVYFVRISFAFRSLVPFAAGVAKLAPPSANCLRHCQPCLNSLASMG